MRKLPSALLLGTILSLAAPANAQDVSGGIDAKSSYVLGDYLYVGSNGPVLQGYVDVAIGDTGCKGSTWGNLSENGIGNELDLGAGCTFKADEKTTVTVTATRYLLLDKGVPDMTAITSTVTRGRVDINAGVYLWDHRPDGYAANIGYTLPIEDLSIRGSLHYAHGLGDDDIVFAGAKVSYLLTSHLTASVQGYVPLMQSDRDVRRARVVGGLSLSF